MKNLTTFVTVIMPIRNEANYIERSLSAVLAQDYPPDRMEIIVVDGMSTDDTQNIVRSFQSQHANLQLIDNPGKIVATGLNTAVAQAKGEIIVRVDGHCEIAPNYVRQCVKYLQQDGIGGVGGPLETIGETSLSQTIAIGMSSPFGVGGSAFRTISNKTMLADTVAFPGYTRAVLKQAGPFDEELVRNQDDEYNYRLRKMGVKILLAADIQSRYYSRGSLQKLWRQYFQYGYWKVRVMQKHPHQMRPRQFVPPLFVLALFCTTILAFFFGFGQALLAVIVGTYAVASLGASILTAHKDGWHHVWLLPIIFGILHLSYGLGFLLGLVSFWNRWGDNRTSLS